MPPFPCNARDGNEALIGVGDFALAIVVAPPGHYRPVATQPHAAPPATRDRNEVFQVGLFDSLLDSSFDDRSALLSVNITVGGAMAIRVSAAMERESLRIPFASLRSVCLVNRPLGGIQRHGWIVSVNAKKHTG